MALSESQAKTLYDVKDWYKESDSNEQVFSISGGPGTGKTFLISFIMDELDLKTHNVAYCTFTGRASMVLWEKGIQSTTINQLIYRNEVELVPIIENGKEIGMEKKLKTYKKERLSPTIKLIVVDEVSMVSEIFMKDILSFGIKVLCVGDMNQIPPVNAKPNKYLEKPNAILKENFRQGDDSDIVNIANDIINNKMIKYGKYGNSVIVAPINTLNVDHLVKMDQVITTKNNRRSEVNNIIREKMGYNGVIPSIGEKLICTANDWTFEAYSPLLKKDIPLVNGLIGYVKNIKKVDMKNKILTIDLVSDFDSKLIFKDLKIDLQYMIPNSKYIKRKQDEPLQRFDYGSSITVHKAQGSEFQTMGLIIDNMPGSKEFMNKLIYTGITRAKDRLIIYI